MAYFEFGSQVLTIGLDKITSSPASMSSGLFNKKEEAEASSFESLYCPGAVLFLRTVLLIEQSDA
jgi:hypothetical protein